MERQHIEIPKVSILVPRLPHTVIPRCLDSIYRVAAAIPTNDIKFQEGTLLADQRNSLVRLFLESDSEFALFLDSDMVFPTNLGKTMLQAMEARNIDILTGLYFSKIKEDPTPLVSKYIGDGFFIPRVTEVVEYFAKHPPVLPLFNDAPLDEALLEIDGCGLGCMMVRRKVFETIPEPWFSFEKNCSEDYYFCLKAREHGFKIFADLRITPEHYTVTGVGVSDFMIANPKSDLDFRLKLGALLIHVASELTGKEPSQIAKLVPFGPQLVFAKHKAGIKDLFDHEEALYDLICWNTSAAFSKLLKAVFAYVPIFKESNLPVLCFGSGLGVDALFLAKHGVQNIIYYDKSKLMQRFARRLFEIENVKIKLLDNIDDLCSVCGIIALDVFEHIEHDEVVKLLELFKKRLKPGGLLIVHAPGPDKLHPFHKLHNLEKLLSEDFTRIAGIVWRRK